MGTKSVGFNLVYNKLCRVFQGQLLIYLGWCAKFDEPISSSIAQYVKMILILRVSLFLERKQFSKLLTIYISVCTCRCSVYSAFVELQFMLFCCQSHASLFSLLFVCLLSHFCSSSESNSDSDKQKSGKKNKDKPKRYESAIFIWKRKLLHFHHYSLSRSSILPHIILLWTSLNCEHQK